MKITTCKCDICGTDIHGRDCKSVDMFGHGDGVTRYDLCPECFTKAKTAIEQLKSTPALERIADALEKQNAGTDVHVFIGGERFDQLVVNRVQNQ